MAEVGRWYVSVMPDMKHFNRVLSTAATSSGSKFGGVMSTALGVALGGVVQQGLNAFVGALDTGIQRLDTLETFPRVMQNLNVATEDAARGAIKTLSERLEGLPTALDAATASVQRFAMRNGDLNKSVDIFTALNDALLSGGSSAEVQALALEQVSQAYAKGTPDYREWLSMTQSMNPALQMVAKAWNTDVETMGEALRKGEISMDDFMLTLMELDKEGVDGMASLSEQASVSLDNLGTAIGLIGTRMGKAWADILDAIGRGRLVELIDGATTGFRAAVTDYLVPAIENAMQWLDDFAEASQPIKDAYDDLTAELSERFTPVFEEIGQAIQDNLPTIDELVEAISGFITLVSDNLDAIITFAGMFAAFNAVMALVPVFTAIGGAMAWLVGGIGAVTATLAGLAEGFMLIVGGAATVGEVIGLLGASLFPVVGVIAAIAVAIALNWETVSAWLSELGAGFVELGTWIDTFFGQTIPNAIDAGLKAVAPWFEELGAGFMELLEWLGSVAAAIDTFFGQTVPGVIDAGLRAIGKWFSDGISGWVRTFQIGLDGIRNYFANGLAGWSNLVQTAVNAVRNYFSNGIAGWKRLFTAFVDGIKAIPGQIVGFFSGIGSRISSAIGNIHFPAPHVSWESTKIPGLSLPKISWYAQGGFVNGAQLIGAGEKGTELIWPSYGSALDRYGAAIAKHMDGAGTVYNVYMNDIAVNDNAAIRNDVLQLLTDMQRVGAMNRG